MHVPLSVRSLVVDKRRFSEGRRMLKRRPENDILGRVSGFCIKCWSFFYEKKKRSKSVGGSGKVKRKKKKKKNRTTFTPNRVCFIKWRLPTNTRRRFDEITDFLPFQNPLGTSGPPGDPFSIPLIAHLRYFLCTFLGRSLSRYCRELLGYVSMYRCTHNYKYSYSYRSIALAVTGFGPAKNRLFIRRHPDLIGKWIYTYVPDFDTILVNQ